MSRTPIFRDEILPASLNSPYSRCRRASTRTPENDQEKPSPIMARNGSRYMLPLPSRIFSQSSPRLDLSSNAQANEGFNLSYDSSRRPETRHTTFSSISTPDLTATALPTFPQPAVPVISHRFGNQATAEIIPPSTRRLIKSSPCSPPKSPKSGTYGGWRRFKVKVKKVFTFKRQKDRSLTSSTEYREPVVIGSPYNFEHVETHGVMPLRTPRLTKALAGNGGENMGGDAGVGRGDHLVTRQKNGAEHTVGAKGAINNASAAPGGLGDVDNEGTVFEDDDDSAWEDYEATSLFTAGHGHL